MRTARSATRDVRRTRVGVRVDGDRLDAELAARADDAHGDLAAVRDEDAADHRSFSARCQPGCPCVLEERAHAFLALGRHAARRDRLGGERWPLRADRGAPTSRDQRLRGRDRSGAAVSSSPTYRRPRVELRGRHDRVDQADLARARGREARAGQEQLARGRPADLRQHERRDHRRDDAELHLGEPEHRVRPRRRRCRRPRPGRRRRRARRRARGRSPAPAGVDRAGTSAPASRRVLRCSPRGCSRPSGAIHATSAPAQNDLPGARRARPRARWIRRRDRVRPPASARAIIASLNALRTSGRLSDRARSTGAVALGSRRCT